MASRLGEYDGGNGVQMQEKAMAPCKPDYQKMLSRLIEKKIRIEKYFNILNELSVDDVPSEIKRKDFNLCELIGYFAISLNEISVREAELIKTIENEKADGTK